MDTGRLCNWETQIAGHTRTAETEVSESPSYPVQWTFRNECSKFPKKYQSASLYQVIQVVMMTWLFLTITTAIEREKQEDFGYVERYVGISCENQKSVSQPRTFLKDSLQIRANNFYQTITTVNWVILFSILFFMPSRSHCRFLFCHKKF